MVRISVLVLALALLPLAQAVQARQPRSQAAKTAFARTHPCPATGQPIPRCPGYQIDHITPLCAGGPDQPCNMQWLTITAHKSKTIVDLGTCMIRP